ncbi:MAG TPA: DUF1684 domain-containing protein [Bryobacteraceae bacterium]|nr:DUF1684 domain-containing protein [Bryobacteraceae bacterium]
MRSLLLFVTAGVVLAAISPDYVNQILAWRKAREAELRAGDGWLSVAGLFWLSDGANTAGTDPSSAIMLPAGSAPAHVGIFEFHDGRTTFRPDPGSGALVNGKPAQSAELKSDTDTGGPDMVTCRDLTMFVIHRGNRYAIRLRDKSSEYRRDFTGLHWYPVKPEYRVVAKWVAYAKPKPMSIPNVLGETEQDSSPGYAEFKLQGKELRLTPVIDEGQLFFIFRDLTSKTATYQPGRFLYSDLPKNGEVVLDFNKAYNPPCAFTPYATCPLPPAENRLPVAIEAGELRYGKGHPER